MASIRRQRKPDFSYLYGEYLQVAADACRSIGPAAAWAVRRRATWRCVSGATRQVTDAVIRTWLDRLFARNLWLDIGRKRPIPHESWFQVAGYFFYFGHYYAGAVHRADSPGGPAAAFRTSWPTSCLRLQEKDGSWWDFPLYDYHQQYGTAFALMSLKTDLKAVKGAAAPLKCASVQYQPEAPKARAILLCGPALRPSLRSSG